MSQTNNFDEYKALFSLWRGWTLSFGSVTAVAVASLFLRPVWLAVLAIMLGAVLYAIVRRNRRASLSVCYAVPFLTIYVMGWTAAIVLVLAAVDSPLLEAPGSRPMAPVPALGSLIVYPVSGLLLGYGAIRRFRLSVCADCRRRYGMPAERGFVGLLYSQEGLFQRNLMTLLCGMLAVAGWGYFALRYVNDSFTRADTFAFITIPAIVFFLSVVGMGFRYFSVWYYYNRDIEGTTLRHGRTTSLRYIIISGNDIFLTFPENSDEIVLGDEKVDTPAKLTLPYSRSVALADARYYFLNFFNISQSRGVEVRPMYNNANVSDNCNIFHYFAFLKSRDLLDNANVHGQWCSILSIKDMIDRGECSQLLAAEIIRLHTISMAWKTYDRDGRRLYKIKHYVPTFRICDIHKWNVDYNDPHWLYIAENNEDRPFFRLRKFWTRYISGVRD